MEYPYDDFIREDILRMVPEDGGVIGSIGCGSAATEYELVKLGRTVHGVDIDASAILKASSRITTARLINPHDEEPLFERASLDGLILADVIEHLPLAWERLKEFSEYVKPGGWVVISVPNMRGWEVFKAFILQGDWPEKPTGIFDRTHLQVLTHRRLARWCTNAGLAPETWFDRYDPNGPRRYAFFRTFDILTFHLFHNWCMYQLQVCCRRPIENFGAPAKANR